MLFRACSHLLTKQYAENTAIYYDICPEFYGKCAPMKLWPFGAIQI